MQKHVRNDKKGRSLRTNEVSVAIALFTIHKCLNATPGRFAPRGNALLFVYADPISL